MTEQSTERKILLAATQIFQEKGMDGARMQEIADRAGINKAMLHYYFRSKQLLFEQVFKTVIGTLAPKLKLIVTSEVHLFEKIRTFTHEYIDLLTQHAYLPVFIVNEISRNPNLVKDTFTAEVKGSIDLLKLEVEHLVEQGEIKPIKVEHMLLNLISTSIFPIMVKPITEAIFEMDAQAHRQFLEERKTIVADMLVNSIKR